MREPVAAFSSGPKTGIGWAFAQLKSESMATILERAKSKLEDLVFDRVLADRVLPRYFEINPSPSSNPPAKESVRSILVWNLDSLGDSLWITPALKALRVGYPKAKITLVCSRVAEDVFSTNPNVDLVLPIHASPFYTGRGFVTKAPVAGNYDLMLILEMGSRPADRGRLLGRQMKIPYVIASDLGVLKSASHHKLPANDGTEYWPEYFLRAIDHLGLERVAPKLEIFPSKEDLSALALLSKDWNEQRLIGFHPSVATYARTTKKWPEESFAKLAMLLKTNDSVRFVITGSAEEREECDELAAEIRHVYPEAAVSVVAGLLKIRSFAELLKRLDAFVTGDTSALHFAAASGTPTVALFGATNPKTIAPPSAKVLTTEMTCRPCHVTRDKPPYWPTCIYSEPKCLTQVSPERVAGEVMNLLSQRKARAHAT